MFREEEIRLPEPVSLAEMAAHHRRAWSTVAITLQGYYDGSGSPPSTDRGRTMALAGYAATLPVWAAFEDEWWKTLDDDSNRPKCRYLHMTDANALQGEFSKDRGWTKESVHRLIVDLFNRCFSPRGLVKDSAEALIGAACWIDLGAYERVCEEYPHFAEKKPEALCVDHVVGIGIRQLIGGPNTTTWHDLIDKRQSIELFFDRNEPFRHHILRVWEAFSWHRRPKPLRLVSAIGVTDREASAAIQAADYLAWHTNRDMSSESGNMLSRLLAITAARCHFQKYDYDTLRKTAARWRPDGGYDAVPEPE